MFRGTRVVTKSAFHGRIVPSLFSENDTVDKRRNLICLVRRLTYSNSENIFFTLQKSLYYKIQILLRVLLTTRQLVVEIISEI